MLHSGMLPLNEKEAANEKHSSLLLTVDYTDMNFRLYRAMNMDKIGVQNFSFFIFWKKKSAERDTKTIPGRAIR